VGAGTTTTTTASPRPTTSPPRAAPGALELDDIDRDTLAHWLPDGLYGRATRRDLGDDPPAGAGRLRHFVDEALPGFGDHQDAMVAGRLVAATTRCSATR
jgi:hypothetical protein